VTTTQATVIGTILGAHAAVTVALAILLGRTRERLARVEEQSRQHERELNGRGPPASE
jgi:hypothetical protein